MDNIISEISKAAQRHGCIKRVTLFGSRARKDNNPRSDIDLAVYADGSIYGFVEDIEENVPTLLEFDITDMSGELEPEFVEQVEKEGIIIYEKS